MIPPPPGCECVTDYSACVPTEGELAAKKEPLASESTTLEALLRGDALEKRGPNNSTKEEESLLEIQVGGAVGWIIACCPLSCRGRKLSGMFWMHLLWKIGICLFLL